METLTRNPFTDERLKELLLESLSIQKDSDYNISYALSVAINVLMQKIKSLDPYVNPVTKYELRAWLLDNGFEEKETEDARIKSYENKETREKLAIIFYYNLYNSYYDNREVQTEIEIRASKRNIHPFTLYAEIKLKYGTNNK